ncbi:Glycosyl transferases group 1 [Humidesulfovibrio mexicanus]|uniref:Glycosyl transferases group 1 n=1 Tax=Humidesulfovibrio mexicanus TaxID=147047 RepID=A0A239A2Z1_9BACT|nr:glycosyltransferase [Humidesulfovibrio mexicanus]SNR90005.1 Glycosyl transferases group 1 [Humidesulfovibrio mexicanus]
MNQPLRVCLVHPSGPLPQALRELGCEVLVLAPELSGVFDVSEELSRRGFEPDILLQFERLGPRLLLAGLEEVTAVRMFWALDPHLNAFWQAPYVRLFDVAFSTQSRWARQLADCGAPPPLHLPWHAQNRPFVPFDQRPRLSGFVGRLGPTRSARTWLAALMRQVAPDDFELADGLDVDAMLDFYCQTRVVPNESITGEVNLRLFEAAGCGCVVLAQDLGPEQEALFAPGREMLVCGDALELADALRLLAARPRLAEAMGRAAWERAQADHMPTARAQAVLNAARAATRRGATARDAGLWLALAAARLCEAGRMDAGAAAGLADMAPEALDACDAQALVLDARLRLARLHDDEEGVGALLRRIEADQERLFQPMSAGAPRLACTCSMLCLGLGAAAPGQPDTERALRFGRLAGIPSSEPAPGDPEAGRIRALLDWAARLQALGVPPRGGFGFDPARHVPASAAECLYAVLHRAPGNTEALRALDALLSAEPGAEALRVGLLSDLSLREPQDWRVNLALGLASLRCFRPGPGLEELRLALHTAAQAGHGAVCEQALAQADPQGRIRRALSGECFRPDGAARA